MIGFLSGIVNHVENDVITLAIYTVIDYGFGYEITVFNPPIVTGRPEKYWIHEHAPQDAPHELYGFRERSERDLFRILLTIKGVGPKVAMRIIGNKGVQYSKDGKSLVAVSSTLMAIRGVGATLAQRIMEHCQ